MRRRRQARTNESLSYATLAAVLLLAGGAGSAQQQDAPEPEAEGVSAEQGGSEADPESMVMQPEHRRVSALLGVPVFDVEGAEIGEVDDVVLSDEGLVGAVLAIGGIAGIGEKLVLVPWDQLDKAAEAQAESDDRPEGSLALRDATGKQLADSEPTFRYEPE